LKKIVDIIFDPRVSFPVLDSLTELLREDAEWDHNVPSLNADKGFSSPPEADPSGAK
jgi:hypothetical protein